MSIPKAIVNALGPWYARLLSGFVGVFLACILAAGMFGAYQGCHEVSYDFEVNRARHEARAHVHNKLDKMLKCAIAGCMGTGSCTEAIGATVDYLLDDD